MQREGDNAGRADKKLAAVCGLYCAACSWFIATAEESRKTQTACGADERIGGGYPLPWLPFK